MVLGSLPVPLCSPRRCSSHPSLLSAVECPRSSTYRAKPLYLHSSKPFPGNSLCLLCLAICENVRLVPALRCSVALVYPVFLLGAHCCNIFSGTFVLFLLHLRASGACIGVSVVPRLDLWILLQYFGPCPLRRKVLLSCPGDTSLRLPPSLLSVNQLPAMHASDWTPSAR